ERILIARQTECADCWKAAVRRRRDDEPGNGRHRRRDVAGEVASETAREARGSRSRFARSGTRAITPLRTLPLRANGDGRDALRDGLELEVDVGTERST